MTIVLGVLFLIALVNWVTVIRLENATPVQNFRKVSLLIPVRNEQKRLPSLLDAISKINYPHLETIFLDDESTDETLRILSENEHEGVLVKRGKALPPGWIGKSWACWQLAEESTGEVLVFCDADVLMSPKAIERTLSWMEVEKVEALTVLPFQMLLTWFEKAIIPFVMHLPIFALVPLRWVAKLNRPSLVVANGQWFAIERKAYFKVDGHRCCSQSLIEDMELGRSLVKKGYRVLPVLGVQDIQVRMYDSWQALKEGFTKNLYYLSGGNSFSVILVLVVTLAVYNFPGWHGLGFLFLLRLVVALAFRTSWVSILYHPIGNLLFAYLLLRSWYHSATRQIVWKDRKANPPLTT